MCLFTGDIQVEQVIVNTLAANTVDIKCSTTTTTTTAAAAATIATTATATATTKAIDIGLVSG